MNPKWPSISWSKLESQLLVYDLLSHTSDDKSPSDNKKSYADAETVKKLQAKIDMLEKRGSIHDDQ